jgi:putative membrane protein
VKLTAPVCLAICGLVTNVHAAPATSGRSEQDGEFLVKAVEVSRQEVWDARSATQSSGRAEIKKAAHSIAHAHVRAMQRLTGLARQKGMSMPGEIAAPGRSAAPGASAALGANAALGAKVGQDNNIASKTDPDRIAEFLKVHEAAVALFHQEAVRGMDPDLKRFAQITLPSLQRRLVALRSLQAAYPPDMYTPNSDG